MMDRYLYHYMARHEAPRRNERPDGDTCRALIDVGFDGSFSKMLRFARINCPELSDPTGAGFAARDFMRTLWPIGSDRYIQSIGKDKYGRRLAEIWLPDGRCLNDVLVQAGHAVYQKYTLDGN